VTVIALIIQITNVTLNELLKECCGFMKNKGISWQVMVFCIRLRRDFYSGERIVLWGVGEMPYVELVNRRAM
jgi:hypothetical protein